MTPERWKRLRALFDEAVDRAPLERERFLAGLALKDAELGSEVADLVASSEAAEGFLERPAFEQFFAGHPPEDALLPGARVGRYEIVRRIGEGGMGTVYLAVRADRELAGEVALKIVRRGMDSDLILRRFRREREILSVLDHPHIARLLDGGSTEEGLPYFVMEHIPGRHLIEDCDARRLHTRRRLELFQKICGAVAYAHRHLVVHRDIKPTNILVTPDGEPKLLDFGLAKVLQPDPADQRGDRTETALRFLTPHYASPEQIRGAPISTASDVYSLGVVLYELLTGHPPYRLTGRRPDEIARAVCEEDPDRPSTAVDRTERVTGPEGERLVTPASIGAMREGEPARLSRSLRGDLDTIILTALRKEPERRYPSVERLSEDIRRHLVGRPVQARKDSFRYRTSKFVIRHKVGVGVAALVALLLVGAGFVTLDQARIARAERASAERHFNDVRALADSFLFEFHDAIQTLPGATPARRLVVRRALEYLEKLSRVRSEDPALARQLASAYERLSKVQGGLFESHLGDTDGARRSLLRALEIREALARKDPENASDRGAIAETELQLSQVLMSAGDSAGSAARARRAIRLLEALSASSPADVPLRGRSARARRYLGAALGLSGEREEALANLRHAARVFETLSLVSPGPPYQRELAITHQMIVYALAGTRERERALESYRTACGIYEDLARGDPGNFQLRRELSYTHVSMGTFLSWSGDGAGGLEHYLRAQPILESLVRADPRNADARLLLAEVYNSVGYSRAETGDPARGIRDLEKSLRIFDSLIAADPANTRSRLGLARLYESLGTAWEAVGDGAPETGKASPLRTARQWYAKSRRAYLALRDAGGLDRQPAEELREVSAKLEAMDRTLSALGSPSRPR